MVVGAGAVGLCTAEALLRAGTDVVVVERGARERDGASFGNAGLIVPSHVTPLAAPGVLGQGLRWMLDRAGPFYVQPRLDPSLVEWGWRFLRAATAARVAAAAPVLRDLHLASRALHLELAARVPGAPPVHERGLLMLCRTETALHEETRAADAAISLGLRAEAVGAAAASDRLGCAAEAVGAVHYLDDAHLSPRPFMEALQAHVERQGARMRWGAEAVGLEREAGHVVGVRLASGERIDASRVVLAGGAASARLARAAGVRLPMVAGRGYGVTVAGPSQRPVTPAILVEDRVAVTPLGSGVRVGGTMEIADPDRPVDARRVDGIARAVARMLPTFAPEAIREGPVWTGLRPLSADGLPYLGAARRCAGLVIATGHGMMGLSLAPVSGQISADLVLGRRPPLASPLLDPERCSRRGAA